MGFSMGFPTMEPSKFLIASLLVAFVTARILQVEIDAGTIVGGSCNGTNSTSFLGIPYAVPPIGDLRWQPPQGYNATYEGGTLIATTQPHSCYQFGPFATEPGPYSEDCLFLNIWVPEAADGDSPRLPVKVFIHGGANTGGSISNPIYNGCNLAEDGAIVVNLAYRLGPLGFLALESAGIKGNFAIQDLILGLEWVQENIGKFGGNKHHVLVFGQSAGAWNAFIISTLPQAPELMRAVALESGGGVDFQTKASAQQAGAIFATQVNCSITDAACLRALEPEQMNNISLNPDNPGIASFSIIHPAMQPYIDGTIIPAQPAEVGVQVPAVFGTMGAEGTIFVFFATGDPTKVTEELLTAFLSYEFGPLADEIEAQYPADLFSSHPFPVFARAAQISTDYAWKCPAHRGALGAADNSIPAWMYIFNHQSSCPQAAGVPDSFWDLLGPLHGSDIPYVFYNLEGFPLPNGTCDYNDYERNISQTMVNAWTSLAINGNASTEIFNWPIFNDARSQGLLIDQNTTDIEQLTSNYTICAFWDEINLLIRAAAETNSTNPVNEIPPSFTISGTSSPTATEASDKPNTGVKGQNASAFTVVMAVVAPILLTWFT